MEMGSSEVQYEFISLMNKMGGIFASECGFVNIQNYLRGLLGNAERKNGWQLSEYAGESTPYALQQFIYRGRYSADSLQEKLDM